MLVDFKDTNANGYGKLFSLCPALIAAIWDAHVKIITCCIRHVLGYILCGNDLLWIAW